MCPIIQRKPKLKRIFCNVSQMLSPFGAGDDDELDWPNTAKHVVTITNNSIIFFIITNFKYFIILFKFSEEHDSIQPVNIDYQQNTCDVKYGFLKNTFTNGSKKNMQQLHYNSGCYKTVQSA